MTAIPAAETRFLGDSSALDNTIPILDMISPENFEREDIPSCLAACRACPRFRRARQLQKSSKFRPSTPRLSWCAATTGWCAASTTFAVIAATSWCGLARAVGRASSVALGPLRLGQEDAAARSAPPAPFHQGLITKSNAERRGRCIPWRTRMMWSERRPRPGER